MVHVGGYHDACGGYHDACGGYLEYRGGVQYRGARKKTLGFESFDSQKISLLFSVHHLFSLCLADWLLSKMQYDSSHKSHNDKFLFRANEDRKNGGSQKEHQ